MSFALLRCSLVLITSITVRWNALPDIDRLLTGAEIDVEAELLSTAIIPHTVGLVIGGTAIIEDDVVLMPHVVLGALDSAAKAEAIHAYWQEHLLAHVQNCLALSLWEGVPGLALTHWFSSMSQHDNPNKSDLLKSFNIP